MRTETNISRYDDNLCKTGDCLSNHLFSKHPNLLERDCDCRYVSINEEVSNEFLIQVLNKQFGLSRLRQFYEPKYRSSQNKCVNLRLAKSLFPRDCDSQVETLQPYEKIS